MTPSEALAFVNKLMAETSPGRGADLARREAAVLFRAAAAMRTLTVKDLAAASDAPCPDVLSAAQGLERRGLAAVHKLSPDPDLTVVEPTPAGLAFVAAVSERLATLEAAQAPRNAA